MNIESHKKSNDETFSNDYNLPEEYKTVIDEMIAEEESDKAEYVSYNDIKNRFKRQTLPTANSKLQTTSLPLQHFYRFIIAGN